MEQFFLARPQNPFLQTTAFSRVEVWFRQRRWLQQVFVHNKENCICDVLVCCSMTSLLSFKQAKTEKARWKPLFHVLPFCSLRQPVHRCSFTNTTCSSFIAFYIRVEKYKKRKDKETVLGFVKSLTSVEFIQIEVEKTILKSKCQNWNKLNKN